MISKFLYGIKEPIGQIKFNKLLDNYKPGKIISVFPIWNWNIKNYIDEKGKDFQFGIFMTDAINIQTFRYINHKYVDKFFVIDKYTKEKIMKNFKIPEKKIIVSFFPLNKEKFVNKKYIGNKNIIILLTGLKEEIVYNLLKNLKGYNITILKGRNDKVYYNLKNIYNKKFKFIEFMDILENLKYYDLVIGKPGGALTSECIATDTPIIVPSYYPGQEKGNSIFLQKSGTGIYEKNYEKILFLIKHLKWNNLLDNFYKIKNENSCEIIYNNL